jgi:hypothetical protein
MFERKGKMKIVGIGGTALIGSKTMIDPKLERCEPVWRHTSRRRVGSEFASRMLKRC